MPSRPASEKNISGPIRVAIAEDHQSIIDGYTYRLGGPSVRITGTARFGEEIEPLLAGQPADVLILDIHVPISAENANPYPILHLIPRLLKKHPRLKILVISMLTQPSLTEALVDAGISGYVYKDDYTSIQQLTRVVEVIAAGGIYFSKGAHRAARDERTAPALTPRQLEALSLCATYPDEPASVLAARLNIAPSTFRNLLSGSYKRLVVRTRAAAIARASQLGLLPGPSKRR